MKTEKTLMPYQQSLVDEASSRTPRQTFTKFCISATVLLVAAALVARFTDTISTAFNGWLVIVSALYVVLNIFTAVCSTLLAGVLMLVRFTMKQLEEVPPWEKDADKLRY